MGDEIIPFEFYENDPDDNNAEEAKTDPEFVYEPQKPADNVSRWYGYGGSQNQGWEGGAPPENAAFNEQEAINNTFRANDFSVSPYTANGANLQGYGPQFGDPEVDPDNYLGEWDWENPDIIDSSPMNHKGEKLPEGAVAWDPNGDAFFGEGITGWWAKVVYKFTKDVTPLEDLPGVITEDKRTLPQRFDDIFDIKSQGALVTGKEDDGIAIGEEIKIFAGGELARVVNSYQKLSYWLDGGDDRMYQNPGVFGYINRALGIVVGDVLLEGLGQGAKAIKRTHGTYANTVTELAIEKGVAQLQHPDWMPEWVQMLSKITIGASWNNLNVLFNPDVRPEYGHAVDVLKENYEASRMAYTVMSDITIKEEFIRRYKEGANPALLAMELQNPTIEFVGELVFDPLNVIGWFAKGIRTSGRMASSADELLATGSKIVDDTLKAAKSVDHIRDLDNFEEFIEVVKATNVTAITRIDDIAHTRGLRAATTAGKRFHVIRRVGDMLGNLMYSVKDTDDLVEYVRGMILMAGRSTDEIAEGISIAIKAPAPRTFFSRSGQETGQVLRSMLTREDGVLDFGYFLEGFQEAQKGGVNDVLEFLEPLYKKSVDDLFPTILQRMENGEDVGKWTGTLAAIDKVAKDEVYSLANKFFGGLYMGMSPGFAFRNLITNSVVMLMDDIGAAVKIRKGKLVSAQDYHDDGVKWLAGFEHSGMRMDFGLTPLAGEVTKTSNTFLGRLWDKAQFSTKIAANFEKSASWRVMGKSIEDTMRKGLRSGMGMADARILRDAGLDEDGVRLLFSYVDEHFGDVDKAIDALRSDVSKGTVRITDSITFLDTADVQKLQDYGLKESFVRVNRDAVSAEDAVVAQKKMFDDELFSQIDMIYKEHPGVTDDMSEFEDVIAGAYANTKGDMSNAASTVATGRRTANEMAMSEYRDGVTLLFSEAAKLDFVPVDQLKQLRNKYDDLMNGAIHAGAGEASTEFVQKTRAIYDEILDTKNGDWAKLWRKAGISDSPPPGLSKRLLTKNLWENHFRGWMKHHWRGARETQTKLAESFFEELSVLTNGESSATLLTQARKSLEHARLMDDVEWMGDGLVHLRTQLQLAIDRDNIPQAIRILANQFDVATISATGKPFDTHIINLLNKHGGGSWSSLDDFSSTDDLEKVLGIFNIRQEGKGFHPYMMDFNNLNAPKGKIPPVWNMHTTPSIGRVIYEQAEGLRVWQDELAEMTRKAWGSRSAAPLDSKMEDALAAWGKESHGRITELRAIAGNVASEARKFAFHDYPDRTNLDLAVSYLFPYHFWHTRTYKTMFARIASNPGTIAAYAKYKDALAQINAGAPEWYRYNMKIDLDGLFGIDKDNPLYFNLEATLNPINGLTGVDFDDPYKRVDALTQTMDDINKFGPSTFTPINMLIALGLKAKGENDAAARWGGRLVPQTSTLRSAGHVLHQFTGIGSDDIGEIDLSVYFFSGGVDPYERKRIGRALATLVETGERTDEEITDAAFSQGGEVWDEAASLALDQRAIGNLSSFFFGVGFKARSVSDVEVDKFYQEYYKLWAYKDMLRPEEFRDKMNELRNLYPYMDAVLLSRNDSPDRDRGLAYNVLSRIPPGQSSDVAKLIGIDPRLLGKFYDTKGELELWPETEKSRFMDGIIDLTAMLKIPDDATVGEWSETRKRYDRLKKAADYYFGEDITVKVDRYFRLKDAGPDAANSYLDANPVVQEYFEWKTTQVVSDDLLSSYYGGIDTYESYFKSQMYNLIEAEVGEDIWDKWDEYHELKDIANETKLDADKKAASAFYRANKEQFSSYYDIRDEELEKLEAHLEWIAGAIQEPGIEIRDDFEAETIFQQDLLDESGGIGGAVGGGGLSWQDWQGLMSPEQARILQDYVFYGDDLGGYVGLSLEEIAESQGLSVEEMLASIELSLQGQ